MAGKILSLIYKDFRVELRRKHEILASLAFVSVASLAMSLFAYRSLIPEFVVPSLWLFTLFIGIFVSMITFISEYDKHTLEGLRLLPLRPSTIFFAKTIYSYLITLFESLVALIMLSIFSSTYILFKPEIVVVLLLFTLYISSISSFTSMLVMYSEGRSFLIPVLIFILSVPMLLPLVSVSMPMIPFNIMDVYLLLAGTSSFFFVALTLSEYVLEV